MPLPAHLSALSAAALFAVCHLGAAEMVVLGRDGSRASGAVRLVGQALQVGDRSTPIDQLVAVAGDSQQPARWQQQGLLLTNGDRLRGLVIGVQNSVCAGSSDLLGPFSLPVDGIAAITLAPHRMTATWPAGFAGAILANGDRLPGAMAYIDGRQVGIDNGRKVVGIPRERVTAVVLRGITRPAAARQVLWLANGDRLTVTLTAWTAEGLACDTPLGALRCAPAELAALWSEGPDQRPLTGLPIEGLAPGVAVDQRLNGGPLVCAGRPCAHGLAVRGAASLTAPVGDAARLVGDIAVEQGRASVRIIADTGRVLWDSGVLTAGGGTAFSAALAGASRLRIDIVPADAGAPRVVIGWPTLVR